MRTMKYRGYIGSVEIDIEDNVVHGKLLHIKDLVTYEAETPAKLKEEFEGAVDDYLADCQDAGIAPDVPFKGQFNVRVSPDLHRELAVCAQANDVSLNQYVVNVLGCHKQVGPNGTPLPSGDQNFLLVRHGVPEVRMYDQARFTVQQSSAMPQRGGGGRVTSGSGWVTEGPKYAKH